MTSDYNSDVGPAAMFVGNIVQGIRIASAQGRDLGPPEDERVFQKIFPINSYKSVFFIFQLVYLAELLRLSKLC